MTDWAFEKSLLINFASSSDAYKLTDELRMHLGFAARAPIARMAIGRSLSEKTMPPKIPDMLGKPIKGDTLFSIDDHALWIALLVSNFRDIYPKTPITLQQLQDLVARHWHRGVNLLHEDWSEAGSYTKFIEILITRRACLPEDTNGTKSGNRIDQSADEWIGPEPVAKAVRIEIGHDDIINPANKHQLHPLSLLGTC